MFLVNEKVPAPYEPDRVESYTVGSFDRLQIRKYYTLSPDDSPARIPREDFQQYGLVFHLSELTKERIGEADVYTAVFNEAGTAALEQ